MFAYTLSLSNITLFVCVRVNILVASHVPVDAHIQMLNPFTYSLIFINKCS